MPECLKKFIKPITHDYAFFKNNNSITEKKFNKGNIMYNQDTCTICYDLFEDNELTSILKCHHVYHCSCIKAWVDKKTEKSQLCPVCNHPISRHTVVAQAAPAIELADMANAEPINQILPLNDEDDLNMSTTPMNRDYGQVENEDENQETKADLNEKV